MLVVIAIIGILITMLLPSLRRSMRLAAATICQYNLKEIGTSLAMYRLENSGWLPYVESARGISNGEVDPSKVPPWFMKLYPTYLQDPMILACPDDPYGHRLSAVRDRITTEVSVGDYASYGINNFIMTAGGGYLANIERHKPSRPLDTILMADLGPDTLYSGSKPTAVPGPSRNAGLMMWSDGYDPFSGLASSPWVTQRHNHGIHALTLGGGIRGVSTRDVLASPLRRSYPSCSAGGCALCNELNVFHYSFAEQHLFWWTGRVPTE